MIEIEGYTVVPLRLTPDEKECHSIYMREHFIRLMDPNKPKGRTLFLLNIPPYMTESSLETFFTQFGQVENVTFAAKPGRDETINWLENNEDNIPFTKVWANFQFKVAYVAFKKSNSVARALGLKSIDLFSSTTGECFIKSGMELWHKEYDDLILDVHKTQELIDEFMTKYDKSEKELLEASKSSEADPDGWVTVGKEGRNAGFEQKESVIGRLENKLAKIKLTKQLKNFYTFQIRETKMKNIVDLRKKYEEDKTKIAQLKETRRFRPF